MPDPAAGVDRRRRLFMPTVLAGLASAALLAVAASRPLAEASGASGTPQDGGSAPGYGSEALGDVGELPLPAALSLVLLAAWGVLLVTRGIVRRAVAIVAVLAAAGTVVALLVGWGDAADAIRDSYRDVLAAGGDGDIEVGRTPWWWAAVAAGVISTAASMVAVWAVPRWPEMGQRYDAPTGAAARRAGRGAAPTDPAVRSEGELWRDIDEGHDPTA